MNTVNCIPSKKLLFAEAKTICTAPKSYISKKIMTIKQITTKLASRVFAQTASKSITFSITALSLLAQSTVVYSQDRKLDQLWQSVPSSNPSDTRTTNYVLKNKANSRLCLGVVGADTRPPKPGARVEVFTCGSELNDPRRDQLWRMDPTSREERYFRIRNFVSPNYCLGVVGADTLRSGSKAEIFPCFGVNGDPRIDNQWKFDTKTGVYGYSNIRNRANRGLCLGVVGSNPPTPRAGARVEVHPCRSNY